MLQQRLDTYKNMQEANTLELVISQNSYFDTYLQSFAPHAKDKSNALGTLQFSFGMRVAEHLFNTFKVISDISVYQRRLIIILRKKRRINDLLVLLSNELTRFMLGFYEFPEFRINSYNLPEEEVLNFKRMWQYIWIATRNRILGEIHLKIPASNKQHIHTEIAKEVFNFYPLQNKSFEDSFTLMHPEVCLYGVNYNGGWQRIKY